MCIRSVPFSRSTSSLVLLLTYHRCSEQNHLHQTGIEIPNWFRTIRNVNGPIPKKKRKNHPTTCPNFSNHHPTPSPTNKQKMWHGIKNINGLWNTEYVKNRLKWMHLLGLFGLQIQSDPTRLENPYRIGLPNFPCVPQQADILSYFDFSTFHLLPKGWACC